MRLFFRKRLDSIALHRTNILPVDVQARYRAKYRSDQIVFIMFVMTILSQLLLILFFLFSGAVPILWSAIIYQKVSPVENLLLFTLGLLILVLIYANFKLLTFAHEFLQFHSFFHLYDVCRYVSPDQIKQLRIPQALFRYHIHFDYGFAGTKILFLIKKQHMSQDMLELEAENIVNSTVVAAQQNPHVLELSSDEISGEIPIDLAQKLDTEVSQTERENQGQLPSLNGTALVEAQAQSEQKQNKEVFQETELEKYRLLISIGQTVSFTLEEEQTKKQVNFSMNNNFTAIMTYLAIRPKEQWIERKKLVKDIYGDDTPKNLKLFNTHTSRIRENIDAAMLEIFTSKVSTQKLLKENLRNPFEKILNGREDSQWRLSPFCQVTGTNILKSLYRKIKADTGLTDKEWRKGVHQLREIYAHCYLDRYSNEEEYFGGYLSEYLQDDVFKDWALAFFKECRIQFIYVLEHVAEYERRISATEHNDKGIKVAAELYKECSYAASCSPIDQKSGENALRKCIDMYILIHDKDAAQDVCNVYAKRIKNIMLVWEPERETEKYLDRHNLVID